MPAFGAIDLDEPEHQVGRFAECPRGGHCLGQFEILRFFGRAAGDLCRNNACRRYAGKEHPP
jgi:hypothetical protein